MPSRLLKEMCSVSSVFIHVQLSVTVSAANVCLVVALTDVGCGGVVSHLMRIEKIDMSGIKQLTSVPFLPIIAGACKSGAIV